MGGFNIDITHSINDKWMNRIQLYVLTQLVNSTTRVTQSSSTIIDQVYTSNPENITETFVPYYAISDHFPVCLSRKVNAKISKPEHSTASYRCFKKLMKLEYFKSDRESVDEDFAAWHSVVIQCLDRHAPIKHKRPRSDSTTLPWSLGHTSHLGTILTVILVPIRECKE